MNPSFHNTAVQGLRWVLGIVVLWESCLFLRATILRAHDAGHIGVHSWFFLVLAAAEIIAAAMFLAPLTKVSGGYLCWWCFSSPRCFTFCMVNSTWLADWRCTPRRWWCA